MPLSLNSYISTAAHAQSMKPVPSTKVRVRLGRNSAFGRIDPDAGKPSQPLVANAILTNHSYPGPPPTTRPCEHDQCDMGVSAVVGVGNSFENIDKLG